MRLLGSRGFKAFGLKVFGVSGGFGGGRSWTVEGLGFRFWWTLVV